MSRKIIVEDIYRDTATLALYTNSRKSTINAYLKVRCLKLDNFSGDPRMVLVLFNGYGSGCWGLIYIPPL